MFWTRLASGIVLIIIALLTMSLGGVPLLAVTLLIALIAYKELTGALLCATEGKKLNLLEIFASIFAGHLIKRIKKCKTIRYSKAFKMLTQSLLDRHPINR